MPRGAGSSRIPSGHLELPEVVDDTTRPQFVRACMPPGYHRHVHVPNSVFFLTLFLDKITSDPKPIVYYTLLLLFSFDLWVFVPVDIL